MITVRRCVAVLGVAVASLASAHFAVAEQPDANGTRMIQMQTAFNPALPGSGMYIFGVYENGKLVAIRNVFDKM